MLNFVDMLIKIQNDMLKKLFMLLMLSGAVLTAQSQIKRPRLVVGLVVDQMRWDYLYYYYNEFGEGGLKRLVNEGFSCENTMINYVPTVTAIGHSSIYTGSVPALTGITGNNFYIDGRPTYCCEDSTVRSVGSRSKEGQMSPRNLLASTIGDELKMATDYKAKVIGIALKDRAAILPVGHTADAAYWWDTSAGHYVSSTFYMNQLPQWVQDFNKINRQKPGTDVKTSTQGVTLTFKMAEEALEKEQMGQDDITDLLAVSISSTDAIGHTYGTRGKENYEVYMQLDKDLAHFLSLLDRKIGKDNYLLFLSADHGAAHNANLLKHHRISAGGYSISSQSPKLNEYLARQYGVKNLIVGTNSNRVFLNHAKAAQAGIALADIKRTAIEWLKKDERVMYAVDFSNAEYESMPQLIKERIINGYNAHRSGDIYVVTLPEYVAESVTSQYKGTNHSMWNPYDSHIPLVFMGQGIEHGSTVVPTHIVDIAPTVCAMLHIQMPNSCVGDAIPQVVK